MQDEFLENLTVPWMDRFGATRAGLHHCPFMFFLTVSSSRPSVAGISLLMGSKFPTLHFWHDFTPAFQFSPFKSWLQTPSSCIPISLMVPLSSSPGHSLDFDPVIQSFIDQFLLIFPASNLCLLSLLSLVPVPPVDTVNYHLSTDRLDSVEV